MKKSLLLTCLCFLFISCSKQPEIGKILNCNPTKFSNTKKITDFNKNFKLSIPTNWKTELYYNNYQSEIFTADTLKQLSETYILEASYNLGNLNFDSEFHHRKDSILKVNNLKIINSGNHSFKSKPTYWYIVEGEKNNFSYHQFNMLVKLSENGYFTANTEVYGHKNVNERICEAVSLLNNIEFLK